MGQKPMGTAGNGRASRVWKGERRLSRDYGASFLGRHSSNWATFTRRRAPARVKAARAFGVSYPGDAFFDVT